MKIREAKPGDGEDVHRILSHAFDPYRSYYTEEAYSATVLSPREIENRIRAGHMVVLVATCHGVAVGTVSLKPEGEGRIYLQSMAVEPHYQGQAIGKQILSRVETFAKQRKCKHLSLECYHPLIKALGLYEKSGFRVTGKKRNYYGIEIFEMTKELTASKG
ncbi:MAG: GNAT family N-acetyltransferase [Candidatus Thermoplasmatota archaeon]|nr:GNAT family N-acetyltransferase [Candidatus Thermoplasmatota archaeon]MDD5778613.1 GNAT family N-acetyltransferase [Candidatus Thermoplasmatota archaeon]